jgi:hypothetical protein
MGALEYDPAYPGLSADQKQVIDQLEILLERGKSVRAVHVDAAQDGDGIVAANMVGPADGIVAANAVGPCDGIVAANSVGPAFPALVS